MSTGLTYHFVDQQNHNLDMPARRGRSPSVPGDSRPFVSHCRQDFGSDPASPSKNFSLRYRTNAWSNFGTVSRGRKVSSAQCVFFLKKKNNQICSLSPSLSCLLALCAVYSRLMGNGFRREVLCVLMVWWEWLFGLQAMVGSPSSFAEMISFCLRTLANATQVAVLVLFLLM